MEYQSVSGFFEQDDPAKTPALVDALPPRFGLLDESLERWGTFKSKIIKLNQEAASDIQYKVIFFGRHGQGYHNVGEAKYGRKAWDDYWSKLNGDGELTWGPDPDLTELGVSQAMDAHAAWVAETKLEIPIPPPEKQYCSPMTRAIHTHVVTFEGIITNETRKTIILENCREEYGEHTCDKRRSRTFVHSTFPQFVIEEGFAEEDELWTPERESKEHVAMRAKAVLDRIFHEDEEQFISITGHSGIINGFLTVLGWQWYPLHTGGILPVVIKATSHAASARI